jgi:capsular polysaccharide transport system permease protein
MVNDNPKQASADRVVGLNRAKEVRPATAPPPAPRVPSTFQQSMEFERAPIRRRRRRRIIGILVAAIAVAIPILLSAYYGYFATDRYVTEAQFSIRSGSQNTSITDAISGATGIPSAAGMLGAFQDAFVVREYIHSSELVGRIDKELGMVNLFGHDWVDWWSRLDADATREEMVDYWQYRVSADLDATTGLIKLTVAGFTPEESLTLSKHILVASQDLVNRLSEQARSDALSFASSEVEKAEDRLREARSAVTAFRKKAGDIFPEASAKAQLELVAQLDFELAKAKAELAALNLDPRAPTARAATARIDALEKQIATERSKLTGSAAYPGGDEPLSNMVIDYQALEVDRLFAEEFYKGTLTLLESARQEAIKIQRYLVVFVQPGLADEPMEPRRPWAVATVLACTLAAYLILGILYKTVREHIV